MSARTVIVIAKQPVPGRVKTRLQTRFSPEQAAALAAAALSDSLRAVAGSRLDRRVLALEGHGGEWVPSGFEVIGQGEGGLDERIEHCFDEVFASAGLPGPVLLVGMDTPQLTPALLEADWRGADAALGLCPDGGFWAVGLRRPVAGAFVGVPMSTDHTGVDQLARLRALGLRVHLLPELQDVDTPDDAEAVAALAPGTGFAAEYRRLADDPAVVLAGPVAR